VFFRSVGADRDYYGCVYGSKRDTYLAAEFYGGGVYNFAGPFRLFGRRVALVEGTTSESGDDFVTGTIDLRTGHRVRFGPEEQGVVRQLQMIRGGSYAYVSGRAEGGSLSVTKVEVAGSTVLDTDVDRGSLAVRRHRVHWTRNAVAHSAPIR
jgi:hypothetical protein